MADSSKTDESNHAEDSDYRPLEQFDYPEPFDMEVFLNDPNPNVFDPEKVVRASEPFDVDEFIRFIHDARQDTIE